MKTTIFKIPSPEQLKSGFIVRLRSGDLWMVTRIGVNFTKVIVDGKGNYRYLSAYNDSLLVKSGKKELNEMDIVEVYGLVEGSMFYGEASNITVEHRPCLWKRCEKREVTLEEIEEKFGCPVVIVNRKRER